MILKKMQSMTISRRGHKGDDSSNPKLGVSRLRRGAIRGLFGPSDAQKEGAGATK